MAIRSQRHREGYLRIDNRVAGGELLEAATVTCSHCHKIIILNPDRTRPHDHCSGCDHIICRRCVAIKQANGGQCQTFEQVIDQLQNAQERGEAISLVAPSVAPSPRLIDPFATITT